MKRSVDETADRFDEMSDEYDAARSDDAVRCAERVAERAVEGATGDEAVVDVGAGTGAVTFRVAPHVERVYALDISDGMLKKARKKAEERGVTNVEFGRGRFRDLEAEFDLPSVDLVVSNFAMHHLSDDEKADAVDEILRVLAGDGRVVLGDVIIFDEEEVSADYYDPEVDDPATVERLVSIFEERGFSVRAERVGPMAGVVEARL